VDCVVGSGPAGAACAAGLLARGRRVQMVDAGVRLEREREEIVKDLNKSPPELWNPEHLQWFFAEDNQDTTEIPLKLRFGSDYPYRDAELHLAVMNHGVGLRPSLAFGGLSTVWGAAMLPYIEQDAADWPFCIRQLHPHYEAILKLTGLSADRDDLMELLPLFTDSPTYLGLSRQASSMWRTLCRNRGKLREAGILYGRARVAIKAARDSKDLGCLYCGMCMYGCPYGYIYSSEYTVSRFQFNERFAYEPEIVVTSVEEGADHVVVRGHHRLSRRSIDIRADRVYLAAGAISTTGILLRSMAAYERSIIMKDSQYFILPLLLTTRIPNVQGERLHTLSQIFLEILDPAISPYLVHLQVYSFNSLIGRTVRESMGPAAGALETLAREIEGRLMVVQGYIHSAQSGTITVMLGRQSGKERLELTPVINPETQGVVNKVVRKLFKSSFKLGAIPLPPLLHIAKLGRGFHSGGTFPMRKNPAEFETDIWGRPVGWKRVHAVDATVLPSIAATTITFTVMANAHRIASQCWNFE
jgi:choline dehydrogenase-like flavoprotein